MRKAAQSADRLLDKSTLEDLLEKATHIPINRAQFEAQNQLLFKAIAGSVQQTANSVSLRTTEPRPINELPFPSAIANRTIQIDSIVSSLIQFGVGWVFGPAGVGKTMGARIVARRLGGNWASINLRGLNAEQANVVLSSAINWLTEQDINGFLVDDLECLFNPQLSDTLLYLHTTCDRADVLLLFTSPRQPSAEFLFYTSLTVSIEQKLGDFTEHDIGEILTGLGISDTTWVKYIYLVSGCGHPQLAIAAIKGIQNNCWDSSELSNLNSLLTGNTAVEQVRARTRERLLNDLPEGGRRLLERLSLKMGSFRRNLVLEIAQISPEVPDGGIIFDQLIGSWVDQQEGDRFALSPLLSNYAANSLNDKQKREINFEIANAILIEKSLDPIEANSALFAALSGKNTHAVVQLCISVLGSSKAVLEMIAPHLIMFTFKRTDTFAYEDDPVVSQMFRGAQLVLLCYEEERREKMQEALDIFELESARVEHERTSSTMQLLVYAKLLLSTPKFGALPNFWDLVRKIDVLIDNFFKNITSEQSVNIPLREIDGAPVVGFMFLNQAKQIKNINELLPAFEFIDSCEPELRQKLLKPYSNPVFDVHMLVTGAWLSEDRENTMDPTNHSAVYARLEDFANSWNQRDLAVCCRKFRAVIIDEYGDEKDRALSVLNEGLELYGKTNSELVRAKAKVLYRAEDHQGSLELSKELIEANALLSETEKAFLGREAAISAEKQGEYETARRYYLYGSVAAGKCSISEMMPMRVGLMADAALASWHAGDRETCLRDFMAVLGELIDIDPESSLRAAHCHAVSRHVLLWLDQEATGKTILLDNGEETRIYPGVVSNPEPSSDIGKQFITPIEMAWYMLARVENDCCLDVGITQNLAALLPKGPVLEGQFLLTHSIINKAFILLDTDLFITALREIVAEFAYAKEVGDFDKYFNMKNVTYGSLSTPTLEQQASLSPMTEYLVLCYASNCIFRESVVELDKLVDLLKEGLGFNVRYEFLNCLQGLCTSSDYPLSVANLLYKHRHAIHTQESVPPAQIFELAFRALQIAGKMNKTRVMAKPIFEWLTSKWAFIWEHQRFLLRHPASYEKSIAKTSPAKDASCLEKVVDLMQSILLTMGFENENQLSFSLAEFRKIKS